MGKIAMPRDVHNGLGVLIFLFSMAAFGIWNVWKRRRWRYRQVPLSRSGLIWIALGGKMLFLLAPMALIAGALVLFHWNGVMDGADLLGSLCLIVLALLVMIAEPAIRVLRCMAAIFRRWIPLDAWQNRMLVRIGGIWCCMDENWFIRIGEGQYALLWAPMIDFGRHVHILQTRQMRTGNCDTRLEFTDRNGKTIYALCRYDDEIRAWIKEHT